MRFSGPFAFRLALLAIAIVFIAGLTFSFEPITRKYVATEWVCSYCHLEQEYEPAARLSMTRPHQTNPEKAQPECVDCHVPKGIMGAVFAYTHFASATDLFGHFRDRDAERAGPWIPPSAARAYRTRDRLFEYDSITCRSCHIESEIKPKRKRGKRAHASALKSKETCIECHDNLVHRYVEVRDTAYQKPDEPTD